MKIAVCDDNTVFLQEMSGLLNRYSEEQHCVIEYKLFANPLELIAQIENGVHYDAIFLDVLMPGLNGIQSAKDIRVYDNYVKIVFLTCSPEFAIDSYEVKAYQYLLKPIDCEKFFQVLRHLQREMDAAKKNLFMLKTKIGITKISLEKLEYCEVINRKVVLYLNNGEKHECNLRMNDLEEKLSPFGMFMRPHRSFLINMDYIQSITGNSIVMECSAQIPIPREKYMQVKKMYMNYMFSSGTVMISGDES